MPARRLVKLALALPDAALPKAARTLFSGWNGALDAGSGAAALFEIWWMKHLKPGLLTLLVSDAELRALLTPVDHETTLAFLKAPDRRFGAEPTRRRDQLLLSTLAAAVTELSVSLGADPARWRWGDLHHGQFEHPLAAVAGAAGAGLRDVGPFPLGGSSSTPMHTGYRLSDFRCIAGASFRMVVDLADPDRSLCINSPGQSGDPRSPHYGDLAPLWAAGQYVPMPFTRAAVEAAAIERIRLTPATTRRTRAGRR
jgi:penicillin G amidase